MEYNPKYPQPFSLSQAIALDPAVAWDEIARLRNSLIHLRRSQDELREYLRELASEDGDLEVSQAVKENEITIASQDERIFMLKLALTHHGHSVSSKHASEPSTPLPSAVLQRSISLNPQNATGHNSNGLDDIFPTESAPVPNSSETLETEQDRGLYL